MMGEQKSNARTAYINPEADYDFLKEYHEARKMMTTKGTDLNKLSEAVGYLYMYCPEELQSSYSALLLEITMREKYTPNQYPQFTSNYKTIS